MDLSGVDWRLASPQPSSMWPTPEIEELALVWGRFFALPSGLFADLRALARGNPEAFVEAASAMLIGGDAIDALVIRMRAIAGPVADPRAERTRQLHEARRAYGARGRAASSSKIGTVGGPPGPGRPRKRDLPV